MEYALHPIEESSAPAQEKFTISAKGIEKIVSAVTRSYAEASQRWVARDFSIGMSDQDYFHFLEKDVFPQVILYWDLFQSAHWSQFLKDEKAKEYILKQFQSEKIPYEAKKKLFTHPEWHQFIRGRFWSFDSLTRSEVVQMENEILKEHAKNTADHQKPSAESSSTVLRAAGKVASSIWKILKWPWKKE